MKFIIHGKKNILVNRVITLVNYHNVDLFLKSNLLGSGYNVGNQNQIHILSEIQNETSLAPGCFNIPGPIFSQVNLFSTFRALEFACSRVLLFTARKGGKK